MTSMISTAERRVRLVRRHHLGRTAPGVIDAVRALVALHSSDPLTPHLSLRARVPDFQTADLDRALYEARVLLRIHAMRRTLFVVPADEARIFDAGAGREVARRERRRVEGWLGAEMEPGKVPGWLARVEDRVADLLADGRIAGTRELSEAVPELRREVTLGSGKWSGRSAVSSRVLFLMALDGRIVRTHPAGSWRSSQYRWASAEAWFGPGHRPKGREPMEAGAGRTALARRYLAAFGPATLADLRWWTGWTAKHAGAALDEVGAVRVMLDGGVPGLVLPHDVEAGPRAETLEPGTDVGSHPRQSAAARSPSGSVAFLPALDPTPMGWKERGWFLGPHAGRLFDRNGNAGPTIWLDGRVIGGWAQRADGAVVYRLLEDAGTEASKRIAEEAAAIERWMAGAVAMPRFRTPLERELCG